LKNKKTKHENTELLNFNKIKLLGKVIEKIHTAQVEKYKLNPLPIIQNFLKEDLYILSIDEQEQNSKMHEPPSSLNV